MRFVAEKSIRPTGRHLADTRGARISAEVNVQFGLDSFGDVTVDAAGDRVPYPR